MNVEPTADDVAGVDALLQQLAAAAQAGDAASYAALFLPDGAFMPPNQPAVVGRAAIEQWLRTAMSLYEVKIDDFAVEDRRVGATVAYMRYRTRIRFVPRDGGAPVPADQKYVETYVKGADGDWSIAVHMYSSNNAEGGIVG